MFIVVVVVVVIVVVVVVIISIMRRSGGIPYTRANQDNLQLNYYSYSFSVLAEREAKITTFI